MVVRDSSMQAMIAAWIAAPMALLGHCSIAVSVVTARRMLLGLGRRVTLWRVPWLRLRLLLSRR